MTQRVRNFTQAQYQSEKLMSLGKLSAGLSQELNNPASAVVRSAQALKKHLKALPSSFKDVTRIRMEESEVDAVNDMLFKKIEASNQEHELTLMQRNEREDELAAFLEDHGVEDGYEIAENVVNFGWDENDLEEVLEKTSETHFMAIINWINNNLVTEAMVGEIEEASTRIKELVQSVKGYTHMDQAKEEVDFNVHDGLKSTLTMLAHKVKKNNVQIDKHFKNGEAVVSGNPGEMNQVFTNLIDNSLDAMETVEEGTLSIHTYDEAEYIKICIEDTGTGIPEEIQSRVFEILEDKKSIAKVSTEEYVKQH